MNPQFFLLPCVGCGIATSYPQRSFQDIKQHRRQSPTDAGFVNFVCPNCGLGSLHHVDNLEWRESMSFLTLVRPPLYCASLQCGNEYCKARVLAHTTAQSAAPNAQPKKQVHTWKVDVLECPYGHHAKEPVSLKDGHVFAPEGD